MKPIVKRSDANAEYYFREGCFITKLSNSTDDTSVSMARARVEPGIATRWHDLIDTVERYVILSGSGLVEIGDDDLIFLAICSPRFAAENYRDVDTPK